MRHPVVLAAALFATFALTACAQQAPTPAATEPAQASTSQGVKQATATAIQPLSQRKFGAAITESSTTALASLSSDPSRYAAKTVRTEGTVSAVCQSMGCWMEIVDESGQAHVKMAGHSFFIPKNASGHHAVVQGRLLSAAGPACGSNDCNAGATVESGKGAQAQIEATGVELVD